MEEPLEAEREVEVAACVEAAAGEGIEAGGAALAQRQPGRGVRPDHDIGLAGRGRPDLAALADRAPLPGPADVAEADLERGVDPLRRAQVAAGKLCEGF